MRQNKYLWRLKLNCYDSRDHCYHSWDNSCNVWFSQTRMGRGTQYYLSYLYFSCRQIISILEWFRLFTCMYHPSSNKANQISFFLSLFSLARLADRRWLHCYGNWFFFNLNTFLIYLLVINYTSLYNQ